MGDAYIGEVRIFPYTYAPQGWFECNGQTLSITQYPVLYAVIGLQYGGDGRQTFNLPDMRGAAPVGTGTGSGLSAYTAGEKSGTPSLALTPAQMPVHGHPLQGALAASGFTDAPGGAWATMAYSWDGQKYDAVPSYSDQAPDQSLSGKALYPAGSSAAHNNTQPCLAFRFCICYEGVFPSPEA